MEGASLWLQQRRADPMVEPFVLAVVAMLAAATVEAWLSRARHRQQQAMERTVQAIGRGPGPYRLPVSPDERKVQCS